MNKLLKLLGTEYKMSLSYHENLYCVAVRNKDSKTIKMFFDSEQAKLVRFDLLADTVEQCIMKIKN